MKPLENETLKEYLNRCINIVNGDVNNKELINKYTIQYKQYKRGVAEYELYIDDFVDGLVGVSLVDDPAIEMNFIMFSKNKEPKVETKFSISNNEKQIISGPALIPEQRIYRYNEETGEEFFVYFTAETIEKSLTKFMQSGFFNNVNLQHQVEIDGVHLFESWLVSNPENDKAVEMGYDVPKGTWMISFKIENPILWKEFKENNTINGFSIEGYFSRRTTDEKTEDDKTLEEIIKILKAVDETKLAVDDLNEVYILKQD